VTRINGSFVAATGQCKNRCEFASPLYDTDGNEYEARTQVYPHVSDAAQHTIEVIIHWEHDVSDLLGLKLMSAKA